MTEKTFKRVGRIMMAFCIYGAVRFYMDWLYKPMLAICKYIDTLDEVFFWSACLALLVVMIVNKAVKRLRIGKDYEDPG